MKSILDIGLTLETLETLGVPVLAYGTDEFPAFFSRVSGHAAPMRVDTPAEFAAVMARQVGAGHRPAGSRSSTRSRSRTRSPPRRSA